MTQVRLFGRLRQYGTMGEPGAPAVLEIPTAADATVANVLATVGVPLAEAVHVFVNDRLVEPTHPVADGDRLGVFGKDMALLYV